MLFLSYQPNVESKAGVSCNLVELQRVEPNLDAE